MSSGFNHSAERRYDSDSDRLFLVYYALPTVFNRNNWGVSPTSLDANIQSAVNKPVVVYRRNPNNPFHTHQAGSFVHPTLEEAAQELGHAPKAEEYFNWQEKFAIGRVRNVDRRGDKGYAFTLEITDKDAKNILKSDTYRNGIPGWTSPQIISNARIHPEEERTGLFSHWTISHIALVDVPAYGFDQAGVRGKCLGAEQECMIKTRSASQENLGFCVKQATIDLVQSVSSHVESNSNPSHNIMSTNETQSPVPQETVVTTNKPQTIVSDNNATPLSQQPNPQQQPSSSSVGEVNSPSPSTDDKEPSKEAEEVKVNTLDEANATIGQMSSLIKDLQKTVKMQGKELERINVERKQARLSYIIPRDLFKSDKSHFDEVQKTMNENISESWLIEYWKTKRELAMAQSPKQEIPQIIAKSASVQTQHEVPDYGSSNKTTQRSVIDKQLELQKMIIEGGI